MFEERENRGQQPEMAVASHFKEAGKLKTRCENTEQVVGFSDQIIYEYRIVTKAEGESRVGNCDGEEMKATKVDSNGM